MKQAAAKKRLAAKRGRSQPKHRPVHKRPTSSLPMKQAATKKQPAAKRGRSQPKHRPVHKRPASSPHMMQAATKKHRTAKQQPIPKRRSASLAPQGRMPAKLQPDSVRKRPTSSPAKEQLASRRYADSLAKGPPTPAKNQPIPKRYAASPALDMRTPPKQRPGVGAQRQSRAADVQMAAQALRLTATVDPKTGCRQQDQSAVGNAAEAAGAGRSDRYQLRARAAGKTVPAERTASVANEDGTLAKEKAERDRRAREQEQVAAAEARAAKAEAEASAVKEAATRRRKEIEAAHTTAKAASALEQKEAWKMAAEAWKDAAEGRAMDMRHLPQMIGKAIDESLVQYGACIEIKASRQPLLLAPKLERLEGWSSAAAAPSEPATLPAKLPQEDTQRSPPSAGF